MPSIISRIKVWTDGEILFSSDLNTEFDNLVNNLIPASIDDFSVDVAEMQSQVTPGGLGTESLAASLAGELQRLRYVIARMMKADFSKQWYEAPGVDFTQFAAVVAKFPIQTADIGDAQVTTAKIVDANVTTAKIAAAAVDKTRLSAPNVISSSSSGAYSTGSTTGVDVTNLGVSLTTSAGRFVRLYLQPVTATDCYLGASSSDATITITRFTGTPAFYNFRLSAGSNGKVPCGCVSVLDLPTSPGVNSWKVTALVATGGNILEIKNCVLIAEEI